MLKLKKKFQAEEKFPHLCFQSEWVEDESCWITKFNWGIFVREQNTKKSIKNKTSFSKKTHNHRAVGFGGKLEEEKEKNGMETNAMIFAVIKIDKYEWWQKDNHNTSSGLPRGKAERGGGQVPRSPAMFQGPGGS